MHFLVVCEDVENSQPLRKQALAAHLEYVESIMARIAVAGPLVEPQSGEHRSSCFIYEANSEEETLELLVNDPFYQAGVFKQYSIKQFRAVAGNWVGGRNW